MIPVLWDCTALRCAVGCRTMANRRHHTGGRSAPASPKRGPQHARRTLRILRCCAVQIHQVRLYLVPSLSAARDSVAVCCCMLCVCYVLLRAVVLYCNSLISLSSVGQLRHCKPFFLAPALVPIRESLRLEMLTMRPPTEGSAHALSSIRWASFRTPRRLRLAVFNFGADTLLQEKPATAFYLLPWVVFSSLFNSFPYFSPLLVTVAVPFGCHC
ncbi:hypothetical protein F5884DRAFT_282556 [Xylogone sp. PMI_703]|nr:hypothetical protein F5884DRAFT_282556 [Xylogone sp. PMI_703]